MSRAEEKCPFDIQLHKDIWCNGYEQAEKDTIERVIKWVGFNCPQICYLMADMKRDLMTGEMPLTGHGYSNEAEKDLIEKAVTWWSNNLVESEPTKGHYISAFKKYMENK